MNYISVPPQASSLVASIRSMGYKLEEAVADIVDNSIDAKASVISITFNAEHEFVSILDNGHGMEAAELEEAMRYGSKNPDAERDESELGRFGMGLKSASLSQCKVLTVASKCAGAEIAVRQWNVDAINSRQDWALCCLSAEEYLRDNPFLQEQFSALQQQDSGTLVIWQQLDRILNGVKSIDVLINKVKPVSNHLSFVFHRFLAGDKSQGLPALKIILNDEPLRPADPLLQRSNKSTMLFDKEIIDIEGAKVVVQPYLLPMPQKLTKADKWLIGGEENMQRWQGFYVYRNNRLIVWGTWFGLVKKGELSKLARVSIDIPNTLDHLWTLDVKKTKADPPADVLKYLKHITEQISERSKHPFQYRGRQEVKVRRDNKGTETVESIWGQLKHSKGNTEFFINYNNPDLQNFLKKYPQTATDLKLLLSDIELTLPLYGLFNDLNQNNEWMEHKDLQEWLNQAIHSIQEILSFMDAAEIVEILPSLLSRDEYALHRKELKQKLEDIYGHF